MRNAKKKSSGWLPAERRGTWRERWARRLAAQTAEARHACDELRLWRECPVRRCRRRRGCPADEPARCMERRGPGTEQQRDRQAGLATAADLAAQIAAQVAAQLATEAAAEGPSSFPAFPAPGEDFEAEGFEAIARDGGIDYVPRRRSK